MGDKDAKDKLLKAAIELLEETEDTDRITVRQIAQRAGVNAALINYHYQSREKLLFAAIGEVMVQVMDAFRRPPGPDETPKQRVKSMLLELCEVGMQHEKLMRVGAKYQLMSGEFSPAGYLLPALRAAYPDRGEEALRLMALELFIVTNAVLLHCSTVFSFTGLDIADAPQRSRLVDTLIDLYL